MKITVMGNKVILDAPYHPDLPTKAKSVGGRWNSVSRVWEFDVRDEERVRALAREIYGTDGRPAQTVTVRHRITTSEARSPELWMFGRLVAKRPGRDNPVRLGDGVIIVEGTFEASGGSAKYPLIGTSGVVLEIRDVPLSLVTTNSDTWIVEEKTQTSKRQELEARIQALRAELADLERQLKETESK